MKPRERVLKAFRKMDGYPDRVPIQFELCRTLLDHFSKKLGIPARYTPPWRGFIRAGFSGPFWKTWELPGGPDNMFFITTYLCLL